SFVALAREVRALYPGLLTYASNWDDVDDSVLTGELDLIGVNALFSLTHQEGASVAELMQGGARVAERLEAIATHWGKPILLTEVRHTARQETAAQTLSVAH